MRQMAYDTDPRIKAELARENAAKAAVKQAKKLDREKRWREAQALEGAR